MFSIHCEFIQTTTTKSGVECLWFSLGFVVVKGCNVISLNETPFSLVSVLFVKRATVWIYESD